MSNSFFKTSCEIRANVFLKERHSYLQIVEYVVSINPPSTHVGMYLPYTLHAFSQKAISNSPQYLLYEVRV